MKYYSKTHCVVVLAALLAASPVPVSAEQADDLDKHVEQIDKTAVEPNAADEALDEISRKTGVPKRLLVKQQRDTKMGAGSLYIANTLAKESGKSFEEICAARKSGHGWGKIAKENNVKLGPLVSEARKLEKSQKEKVAKGKKGGAKGEKKPKKSGSEDDDKNGGRDEGKDGPKGSNDSKPEKGPKNKKK